MEARSDQQAWLHRVGEQLGLVVRDAGMVTEIELPGPVGAPVLGLIIHGDVQPVNASEWSLPPFSSTEKDGVVYGRGSADDKGPLVQALLAMATLKNIGVGRTHTILLLVGSDEESNNQDMASYLKGHKAPDFSLVLDSLFPVVVGEKAWNTLTVAVEDPYAVRLAHDHANAQFSITHLEAGLATSIVPSRATATLQWSQESLSGLQGAMAQITPKQMPEGYRLNVSTSGRVVNLIAIGRAAHAGMNIDQGRNALVFLARNLQGKVKPSGAADLLEFAREAGRDLHGSGLGLNQQDQLWGRYDVNVTTLKQADVHKLSLTTNIRRIPPMTWRSAQDLPGSTGAQLVPGGFYEDEPLAFDPDSKLVKRLMADYKRVTGENVKPAISGGGTYAKRLPNSVVVDSTPGL